MADHLAARADRWAEHNEAPADRLVSKAERIVPVPSVWAIEWNDLANTGSATARS